MRNCENCEHYKDNGRGFRACEVWECDKDDYMDVINNAVNEIIRQQREHTERTLAEIITKYDFIVGSIECKKKLMEVLPDEANIIFSPYIASQTTIYAIKKFDTMDLLKEPNRTESEEKNEQRTNKGFSACR